VDLKNIIAAITLSAAVIVLYGLFFAPTQEQINNLNNKDEKNITQNTDAPTIDEKIEVKTITREDALVKDNRVFFENAFIFFCLIIPSLFGRRFIFLTAVTNL